MLILGLECTGTVGTVGRHAHGRRNILQCAIMLTEVVPRVASGDVPKFGTVPNNFLFTQATL